MIPPLPFAAAALGLFALLGGSEAHRFEKSAAAEIASHLDGDKCQVSVRTSPEGLLGYLRGDLRSATVRASHFSMAELPVSIDPSLSKAGRVRRLRIVLDDFRLASLHISHLDETMPGCRFDLPLARRTRELRLSACGAGKGEVRVNQADLGAFVAAKYREIKRADVLISEGQISVEGYGEFLLAGSEFKIVGSLRPVNGTQLWLEKASISFAGRPASDAAAQTLLALINPVLDLDKDLHLRGAFKVESLKMGDGFIEALGVATIPSGG